MVIRMAQSIIPEFPPKNFIRPICDHFIRIHVKRNPSPSLIHIHYKLPVPFSIDHFFRRACDRPSPFSIEQSQLTIRPRRSQLNHPHSPNQLSILAIPADPIIFNRALRLTPKISPRRYQTYSKRIMFQSHFQF